MGTADNRVDLLYGTPDLLILCLLVYGPSHGHAIARHIRRWELLSITMARVLRAAD